MAEIWGAAIAAAGALAGGAMAANGAKRAGAAAAAGSNASIAEQMREYNTTRADTAPYRAIGSQAINALGSIYGYAPAAQPLSFEQWGSQNPNAFVLPPAPKQSGLAKHLGHMLNPVAAFQDAGIIKTGGGSGVTGNDQAQSQYQQYLQNFNYSPMSSPKSNPNTMGGATGNAFANNGVDPSSGYMVGPGGSITQGIGGVQPGAGGATAAGPPMPAGPDYSNFFMSPDYQFRRDQGTQGVERTASARGLTGSGNALAALADYNSGLASEEFGNYFNRQAALAGIGQTATNTATTAGMNAANNTSNALMSAADARASGIGSAADAWGNALGTIGGIAYDQWGRPKKTVGG